MNDTPPPGANRTPDPYRNPARFAGSSHSMACVDPFYDPIRDTTKSYESQLLNKSASPKRNPSSNPPKAWDPDL